MTDEIKSRPGTARKPQQVLSAFSGLLALVARKTDEFVAKLDAGTASPLDCAMLRGAIEIVRVGMLDALTALDAIDGGGS